MATDTLGSKKDKLNWLQYGFNQKKDYYSNDRQRWIENAKMYWGVDYSQWPLPVVQQLLEEGRQAPTFNIMAQKMDSLKGSLLRNQFDMKYAPVSADADQWSIILQQMWYSDKNEMRWDWSKDVFLRDFLIQYGAEWMYIDTTNSPFGNIAFKPDVPYNLFPDPNWKTPFHKDLMELDKVAFFTSKELKVYYPDKASEIDDAYLRQKYENKFSRAAMDYKFEAPETGPSYQQLDRRWSEKQQVLERHEIIQEVREWEYNIRDGEWFPETGNKAGSNEDIIAKKHYMEQRGLTPDDVHFLPQNSKRYHITSGCPTLDIELEDKDSIIQIGYIPCFITGPAKMGTQYRGLADLAKDMQLNINKYMMMMSEILSRAARGGMFINEDIVAGDRARMSQIELQWNNPAARIWVKPVDPDMNKYVKEMPSAHVPNDLIAFHGLMQEYADRLLFVNAASEGRSEGSREPNKLFQSKFEANIVARGVIDTMLQIHEHSKAEAYLAQARITYSGVPRTFTAKDGKSKFDINVPTPDGMAWDINACGRHKVIIAPSQSGIDVRINQRGIYMELKQTTRDPLMMAVYDSKIVKTIDMPEEEKDEAEAALELIKEEAATMKMLNIANAKMQIQQLTNPQMAQGGPADQQAQAEGQLPPEEPPMTPGAGPDLEQGAMGTPMQGKVKNPQPVQ